MWSRYTAPAVNKFTIIIHDRWRKRGGRGGWRTIRTSIYMHTKLKTISHLNCRNDVGDYNTFYCLSIVRNIKLYQSKKKCSNKIVVNTNYVVNGQLLHRSLRQYTNTTVRFELKNKHIYEISYFLCVSHNICNDNWTSIKLRGHVTSFSFHLAK